MQVDLASALVCDPAGPSRTERSGSELIRSIAQGDRDAMRALFVQHRLRVYRFALRLVGDKEAAEDLMSEVFLEVWRRAGTFEGRCRVATWLLSIARNRALSMLRRRSRETPNSAMVEAIPDHADDPEMVVQKLQQVAILGHCLSLLSPAHREVIDLVYYHGRSIDEVAAIIGAPQGTVKTRVFHARNHIARLLAHFRAHQAFPTLRASACRPCKRQAHVRAMQIGIH
jgi:RNA polymerase sigma-70 factor, ECF subfamily